MQRRERVIQALQSVKTVLQSLIEFNWQEPKTNFFHKNIHQSSFI